MRILHTSDWHLGRIFYGIYMTDDQAYVLDEFINLVKDAKPDAIVISGDIFDRSVPPVEAIDLLDDVISKILIDINVPIITIAGNHDSPDRVGFGYRLMRGKGFNISGRLDTNPMCTVVEDKYGPVYFYSVPYAEPAVVREKLNDESIHSHDDAARCLLQNIKNGMKEKSRSVLIAHAFVAGCQESESERPLSIGGSGTVDASYFKGFDYVALGHLHRPQKVGCENIRYSGSLMKYSFDEANQKKCVYLVDMDETGGVKVKEAELKPRRDIRRIEGYLKDILKGPQSGESRDDYIMVTIKDNDAILNVMDKLREVYPNVLHVERPQLTPGSSLFGVGRNYKKMGSLDLFSSFYNQVTDIELSQDQGHMFEEILDRFNKETREA